MDTTITAHYADGTSTSYVLTAGDLYRFEKKYGKGAAQRPPEQLSIDQQLFLVWSAAKRTGSTDLDLVDWLDTVTGVDEGG